MLLSLVAGACRSGPPARVRTSDGTVRQQHVDGGARASLARAANEIPCSDGQMSVELLGAGGYRVEGCGARMTYTCLYRSGGLGGHVLCTLNARERSERTARRPPPARGPGASAVTWTETDMQRLHERIEPGVVACLPAAMASVELRIAVTPYGVVRRSPEIRVPDGIARCVDERLSSERMPRRVVEGRSTMMRFERDRQRADVAPPTEPTASAPTAAPADSDAAPSPAGAADGVRAAIDGRALAILACVEAPALSIVLSWTEGGQLDAQLRGARRGTPEEDCVRAIVRQLSIPAPGSAGTLIHALQQP